MERAVIRYLGGVVLAALMFFMAYRSWELPLQDFRETRFAQLGREALEGSHWLEPHLNGTPYLNKPPMMAWLVGLSFSLLGVNEFAARVPSILSMLAIALIAAAMARQLWGKGCSLVASVLFLGLPAAQYYGKMLMSDTVFAAFTTASIALFLRAVESRKRGAYILGAVAASFAFLTKGLIGLIYPFCALLFSYLLCLRQHMRKVPWLSMGFVVALFCLPWLVYIEARIPGSLKHLFLVQQWSRFSSQGHPFVALPRWQIALGLVGLCAPISLITPWSLFTRPVGGLKEASILWIFLVVVIGSVMWSSGRNHPYILPAIPVIVVVAMGCFSSRGEGVVVCKVAALSLMACGVVLMIGATRMDVLGPKLPNALREISRNGRVLRNCLMGVGAGWAIAGMLTLGLGRRAGAVLLAAAMVPAAWLITEMDTHVFPIKSREYLGTIISTKVPKRLPLVVADPQDIQFEGVGGWGFYSGRRVLMVRFSEGPIVTQSPIPPPWIISKEELEGMLRMGTPLVLAATREGISRLSLGHLPPPIAKDGRFGLWVIQGRRAMRPPTSSLGGRFRSW